jgi:predicted transcriptional regulator
MELLGVSQAGLAERLGWTQGAVSHIVTEQRPLTHLARLAVEQMMQVELATQVYNGGLPTSCRGQALLGGAFIEHLLQCHRCMAAAAWDVASQ